MSESAASALFLGDVTHVRVRPRRHRLNYRIASMFLDLDELASLDRRLRLFSVNRFNLFSFYAKDRGDGSGIDLKAQVERRMAEAGLMPDGGPVRLLTMPRILGRSFNPLSIYFCYRRSGAMAAILWEVDNTFGERHGYLIPVSEIVDGEIRQRCGKSFYVSPFLDMDLDYEFRVRPPAETVSVVINTHDAEGLLLFARLAGRRAGLTDRALLRTFLALPLQSLGVVAGISWEALKIWAKGIAVRRRPPPPLQPVSIVLLTPELPEVRPS